MSEQKPISEVTRQFLARDIDNSQFRHEEHVVVAYDLLRNHGFEDASAMYASGIRELAAKASAPQKFNATITFAFLSLIAERLDLSDPGSFDGFAEENPDIMTRTVLNRWYEPERLHSDTARRMFILPAPAAV